MEHTISAVSVHWQFPRSLPSPERLHRGGQPGKRHLGQFGGSSGSNRAIDELDTGEPSERVNPGAIVETLASKGEVLSVQQLREETNRVIRSCSSRRRYAGMRTQNIFSAASDLAESLQAVDYEAWTILLEDSLGLWKARLRDPSSKWSKS